MARFDTYLDSAPAWVDGAVEAVDTETYCDAIAFFEHFATQFGRVAADSGNHTTTTYSCRAERSVI